MENVTKNAPVREALVGWRGKGGVVNYHWGERDFGGGRAATQKIGSDVDLLSTIVNFKKNDPKLKILFPLILKSCYLTALNGSKNKFRLTSYIFPNFPKHLRSFLKIYPNFINFLYHFLTLFRSSKK